MEKKNKGGGLSSLFLNGAVFGFLGFLLSKLVFIFGKKNITLIMLEVLGGVVLKRGNGNRGFKAIKKIIIKKIKKGGNGVVLAGKKQTEYSLNR